MAVGMIKTCPICGETYDEGRGGHWRCDGGAKKRAAKKAFDNFNQQSIDDRLAELYDRILDLEKQVGRIPYNGPIG